MSGDKPSPFDAVPTTYTINPGGRLGAAQGESAAPAPGDAAAQPRARSLRPLALASTQVPQGLADLVPFLVLAIRMRLGSATGDPAQLLRGVQTEITRVFGTLLQRGWEQREGQLAKFFVCCAVDNAALNSPLASTWATNQLASTFFKSASGGAQFFNNVNAMLSADPGSRPPLRLFELAYLCLVCGFEGRYGVANSPREVEIDNLKRRLLAVIGEGGRVSAASFLGTGIPKQEPLVARTWRLPVWPIAALVVAACVILLFSYRALLRGDAEVALAKLEQGASQPLPTPAAAVPVQPPQAAWIDRLRAVANGFGFTVSQEGQKVMVTASGGLFASGSDQLRAELAPAYEKIGSLLNEVRGSVIVRGHTDQQPIRSLEFQNNKDLSRARAKSVGHIVLGALDDKTRVYTEALGDSEPTCRETSKDCLARNRRVEVVLDPGR